MYEMAVILLGASVTAVGLFAGLMLALVVLMEPTWNQRSMPDSIAELQTFLRVAKGHPVIAFLTFAGLLLPIPALILLWQMSNTTAFLLTLVGFLSFGLGVFGVTLRLNLPLYEVLMALEPDNPADRWELSRQRFYRLNRIRGLFSVLAHVCFLCASIAAG